MSQVEDFVDIINSPTLSENGDNIVPVKVYTNRDVLEHVIKTKTGVQSLPGYRHNKKVHKWCDRKTDPRCNSRAVSNEEDSVIAAEERIPTGSKLIHTPNRARTNTTANSSNDSKDLGHKWDGTMHMPQSSDSVPRHPLPIMIPTEQELRKREVYPVIGKSYFNGSGKETECRVKVMDILKYKEKKLPPISNWHPDLDKLLGSGAQRTLISRATYHSKRKYQVEEEPRDNCDEENLQGGKMDEYFSSHHSRQSKSSGKQLSTEVMSSLTGSSLMEAARRDSDSVLSAEKIALKHSYTTQYRKWMLHFCEGRNICLYGVGSKISVLQHFVDTCLHKKYAYINIQAYNQWVSIKEILSSVCEALRVPPVVINNYTMDCVQQLDKQVRQKCDTAGNNAGYKELFLVIHNLDSEQMRSDKSQTILSHLAQLPYLHIIATVDHINAPLMWSDMHLHRFSWRWYDVTTYDSYDEELRHESVSACDAILNSHTTHLALNSLKHVFTSLTTNSKKIFALLLTYHFEHNESADYKGMPFNECYRLCREVFLVNSKPTLTQQFTEFRDHKLIKITKCPDSSDIIQIMLDDKTLQEFREEVLTNDIT